MKKVLVVDDEKPTLNMFRLLLGAYGYTPFLADNGPEGMELYQKERPPITFSDIKMPGMDGFEVLRRIKELDPAAQVVMVTGHGDMDLVLKALDLNADDFINKPIQRSALESALARAERRLGRERNQPCEISLRVVRGVSVVDIKGDLTGGSAETLQKGCEMASSRPGTGVVLNIDPDGSITGESLTRLARSLARCKERNDVVALVGVSENFKKIFQMVGISRSALLLDDEAAAVEAVLSGKPVS